MFARHFNRSPTLLGLDEIRGYQLHLVHEQKLSWGSFNQAVCALRFLYLKTLGKDWNIESIPFAKQPKKLPLVLSQDEVHAVLDAITNPQNRVIAITLYAAGLRAAAGCRKPVTPPAAVLGPAGVSGAGVSAGVQPAPTGSRTSQQKSCASSCERRR